MSQFAPAVVAADDLPAPAVQYTWSVIHVDRVSQRDPHSASRTTIVPSTLTVRVGDDATGTYVRVDGRNRRANGHEGQHPRSIVYYERVPAIGKWLTLDDMPEWMAPYLEYARRRTGREA